MNLSQEAIRRQKYHFQVRISPKSSQSLDIPTSKPKNPLLAEIPI